jgi:hypothetical protein
MVVLVTKLHMVANRDFAAVVEIRAGAGKSPEIPDAPLRFDVGRSLDRPILVIDSESIRSPKRAKEPGVPLWFDLGGRTKEPGTPKSATPEGRHAFCPHMLRSEPPGQAVHGDPAACSYTTPGDTTFPSPRPRQAFPLPIGGHRFPGSHGPTEHIVNGQS